MAIDKTYLHSELSDKILKAFFTVRRSIPYDLALDIYKRALQIEMISIGLSIDTDKEISVLYKGQKVGSVTLDFVADDKIIIKLVHKAEGISKQDRFDMHNHLRLTKYEVGLILNFSAEEDHKRVVLTRDQKTGRANH